MRQWVPKNRREEAIRGQEDAAGVSIRSGRTVGKKLSCEVITVLCWHWQLETGNTVAMTKPAHDPVETVELPERIVERVEARLPRTEFDSPAEYVTYVMEEVLYRVEQETEDDDFEPVDEEEVKDRLKSLGYLDE